MIIVSNGHHKFITGTAAAEAYKKNMLAGFITAGYPTPKIRQLINYLNLYRFAPFQRLLQQQQEVLPDQYIYSNWLSEIIYRISTSIAKYFPRFEHIADYGLRLYAWQTKRIVRKLPAKIYHYRSGYGYGSVNVAKEKGMITLCDHSIVHPLALEYLISNGGKLPPSPQVGHINKMWRNILKDIDQADYILVNSEYVKETFIHFGYDQDRIFVLYTGVDDRFLSLIPQRNFPVFPENPMRFLFAGNLGARKGGRILLNALSRIRNLSWEFEAIGSIDPNLKNEFAELFAEKRVTVTDYLPWAELAEHMSKADIFVFPSLAEGSARVVFMAMACGDYVITTPNSGSIVQDEIHGKIIDPGDVDALVLAMTMSLLNPGLVSTIGRRNADLIKAQYTQSHYGIGLLGIYKKLLEYPLPLPSAGTLLQNKVLDL